MKTWMALATLSAAREGLSQRELLVQAGRLESEARTTLRALGMTNNEIESEFPQEVVSYGVQMIQDDPVEFDQQTNKCAAWLRNRN